MKMKKRVIIMSGAVVLAIAVVGVAAWAGNSSKEGKNEVESEVNVDLDDKWEDKVTDEMKSNTYSKYMQASLEKQITDSCEVSSCGVDLCMPDEKIVSAAIKISTESGDVENLKSEIANYASGFLGLAEDDVTVEIN